MNDQSNNNSNNSQPDNGKELDKNPTKNNNNKDISTYTYKNGNKIVLSGMNLQKPENQKVLSDLISLHPTANEVDISNCNLEKFPDIKIETSIFIGFKK